MLFLVAPALYFDKPLLNGKTVHANFVVNADNFEEAANTSKKYIQETVTSGELNTILLSMYLLEDSNSVMIPVKQERKIFYLKS